MPRENAPVPWIRYGFVSVGVTIAVLGSWAVVWTIAQAKVRREMQRNLDRERLLSLDGSNRAAGLTVENVRLTGELAKLKNEMRRLEKTNALLEGAAALPSCIPVIAAQHPDPFDTDKYDVITVTEDGRVVARWAFPKSTPDAKFRRAEEAISYMIEHFDVAYR